MSKSTHPSHRGQKMTDTRKWVALGSRVYGDGVPYATTYGAGTSGGNVCLALDISKALNSANALPSLVEALEGAQGFFDAVEHALHVAYEQEHEDQMTWAFRIWNAERKAALALAKGE
jgi:hypothetical protein